MNSRQERVQVLYEISLSIGRGDDLEATAQNALSGYLRKLNCSAGAVLERSREYGSLSYDRVAETPARPQRSAGYRASIEALPDEADDAAAFHRSLPTVVERDGDTAYVLDLPEFGVLVLVRTGSELDSNTLAALGPLNQKLADACRAERTERRLRTEQNRFETVFDTISEPLARVRERDGEPVVRAVNQAFAETFGCDRERVRGTDLAAVLDPAPESGRSTVRTDWLADGIVVEREVQYQSVDGPSRFMFRSAPTTTDDGTEHFCFYIDISAQQRRQETLEALVRTAEELFEESDRKAVCERALDTASTVLGFECSQVYLYDRQREALSPVANTGGECVSDSRILGRKSAAWTAYQSGETARIGDASARESQLLGESALLLPLGTHGLFLTCDAGADAFDESDEYYGRLLATLLRSALDGVGRERVLQEVNQTTSELVTAESTEEVATRLVDRAAEAFGLPIFGVWQYDEATNALRPIEHSPAALELVGTAPTFQPGNSIAWEAFESGEPRFVDDMDDEPEAYNEDSPLRSEIIVPIGEFGVIAASSRFPRDFPREMLELLQTLTTGAESAFQLVEQREELDILDQIVARILRHNIRNDISAIRTRAELIAERPSEFGEQNARTIVSKSDELITTAEHAREIRDIVDRRGQRIQFDLLGDVQDIVDAVRDSYPDATIDVTADRATLRTHPDFDRAIRNALENAIEHGDSHSPVRVRSLTTDDELLLEIEDDGPGIPRHELDPLRDQAETPLAHGSGAGLWIIDRVLEYSGGTATFDAEDGTTVRFRFPLAQVDWPDRNDAPQRN